MRSQNPFSRWQVDSIDRKRQASWDNDGERTDYKRKYTISFEHTLGALAPEPPEIPILPLESPANTVYEQSWNDDIAPELLTDSQIYVPAVSSTERYVQTSSVIYANGDQSRGAFDSPYGDSASLPTSSPPTDYVTPDRPSTRNALILEDNFPGAIAQAMPSFTEGNISIIERKDVEPCRGLDIRYPNAQASLNTPASFGHKAPNDLREMQSNSKYLADQIVQGYYTPEKAYTNPLETAVKPGYEMERSFLVSKANHRRPPLSLVTDQASTYSSPSNLVSSITAVEDRSSVSATSTWKPSSGSQEAPVSMETYGDMLNLSFKHSSKHAGIIRSSPLCMLLENYSVRMNAALLAPSKGKSEGSEKTLTDNLYLSLDCIVRIIVYGSLNEKTAVGNILSDAGLYLQHPSPNQCDRHTEYVNPQYLLRPGSQMPNLESLSISSAQKASKTTVTMNDITKSQFMRIFDQANASDTLVKAEPCLRLRSVLKEHQLLALTMMQEKEQGVIDRPMFPSIWEGPFESATVTRYRHRLTGAWEVCPTPARGGILADEMGLDALPKSWSPSSESKSLTTLVVAPKTTARQEQIKEHVKFGEMTSVVYHGSGRSNRQNELQKYDIVLTTYETLQDREIYAFFKAKTAKIAAEISTHHAGSTRSERRRDTNILTLINFLRRICDHGEQILPQPALQAWMARNSSSVDWQTMNDCRPRCTSCGVHTDQGETTASTELELRCRHFVHVCSICAIEAQEQVSAQGLLCPFCAETINDGEGIMNPVAGRRFIRLSAKIDALIQNLRMKHFPEGKADGDSGGKSIDLTTANHVHLLEPHWNPMVEAQAIDRVYRLGQTREVLTTRYVTPNTIEDVSQRTPTSVVYDSQIPLELTDLPLAILQQYVRWIQQDKLRIISQTLDSTDAGATQAESEERRWKVRSATSNYSMTSI
ncbi:MAG: hypothetical protein Q9160_004315 [Pyrenula sp. 1 TL-2023]